MDTDIIIERVYLDLRRAFDYVNYFTCFNKLQTM